YNTAVENIIKKFKSNQYDIVYTMAVLEHIHEESSWIFPEIVRITNNYLITIEDESTLSWRCFPRNYKKIFESFGMKQVEEINCEGVLKKPFNTRIFKKIV
ncbi:MAG: class I SAM-dependent methyltransferase, partial [Candidatus Lokiarchaeota archaeon]|nr:class I SAM-dependent methyltransferase [Candidatus Lokiarchaeota archaeon]